MKNVTRMIGVTFLVSRLVCSVLEEMVKMQFTSNYLASSTGQQEILCAHENGFKNKQEVNKWAQILWLKR